MRRTGWQTNKHAAEKPEAPKEYSLSPEQRARDAQKLKQRLAEMPQYVVEIRSKLATMRGRTRVKTAICLLLSKLFKGFGHSFFVEGGQAYDGNYMTLNLPSHQRMAARGISGQRTDIISRLVCLDELGFIDFEKLETEDFHGWKFRIPLERELDRFRGDRWAQGEEVVVRTAHFRELSRSDFISGGVSQPIHQETLTTVNRLRHKPSIRAVDFSMFYLVALEPEGQTKQEVMDSTGVSSRTAYRQLKLMSDLNLIEKIGTKYFPLSSPCACLERFQSEVDVSLAGRKSFENSLKASIKRQCGLLDQYAYRGIPIHQKRVVKARKAIRAFEQMLKAHQAGEAPSVYMERRYV